MKHITYILFFFVLFFSLFFLWRGVVFPVSSSISYVVIPKNDNAVSIIDGVSQTLSAFPEKAFFAGKVAERYGGILLKEGFSSRDSIVRQWHRRMDVKVESHMITLQAFGPTNRNAEQLVRASANILEDYRGVYYGESVSLELIGSPLSKTHSLWIGFWVSVLGALAGIGVLYLFLGRDAQKESLRKTLPLKKEEPYYRAYEEWAQENEGAHNTSRESIQQESREGKKEEDVEREREDLSYIKQERPVSSEKRKESFAEIQEAPQQVSPRQQPQRASGAPMNLPIATIQEEEQEVPESPSHTEVVSQEEEPTNEEYKKRLNELLRGKMISLL